MLEKKTAGIYRIFLMRYEICQDSWICKHKKKINRIIMQKKCPDLDKIDNKNKK